MPSQVELEELLESLQVGDVATISYRSMRSNTNNILSRTGEVIDVGTFVDKPTITLDSGETKNTVSSAKETEVLFHMSGTFIVNTRTAHRSLLLGELAGVEVE